MSEIITKEMVNKTPDKCYIDGYVLIIDYDLAKREKSTYYDGSIQTTDGNIPFKIWSRAKAFSQLENNNYRNCVCFVKAEINFYGGTHSIIINEIEKSNLFAEDDFYKSAYDINKLRQEFENILERNLSEKGLEMIDLLLLKNEKYDIFCKEYAAKSHHDNCRGGLLAHTLKMLKLLEFKLTIYPEILYNNTQDTKDLLFIGVSMHDYGKIFEMKNGVYQELSYVSHRERGLMHIHTFQDIIQSKYNEKWFYDLIAIISQHHDEFGERANTIASFVVNLIDNEEANFTKIETKLKNDFNSNSTGTFIEIDDKKLFF